MIDGDLESSTRHVLPHVYSRLSPGGICLFGIYYDEAIFSRDETHGHFKSPGVKRATDDFFRDKPEKRERALCQRVFERLLPQAPVLRLPEAPRG